MSEELTELPDGWVWTNIGDICCVVTGKTPSTSNTNFWDGHIPFVTPSQIDISGSILPPNRTLTELGAKQARIIPENSILTVCIGTVGKIGLLNRPSVINQQLNALIPHQTIFAKFLYYWSQYFLRTWIIENASATVNAAILNKSRLETAPVILPPLNEQKRIVTKIEELNDRTHKTKEALESIPQLCDRLRQSVLSAALRGDLTTDWREQNPDVEPASVLLERIRKERRQHWEQAELEKMKAKNKVPKDDKWKDKYQAPETIIVSDLPELPESWCWASAEELTAPGKPIIYGIIKPGTDTPGGVPYVRVNEMKSGTVDIDSLRRCHPDRAAKFSRATLRAGDILISKDGTIGKVAIVPPELEGGNITQHILRFSPSRHMDGQFIARMIETPFAQSWIVSHLKGIGLLGINVEDFRCLPIPVPPLHEQVAIQKLISTHLEKILNIQSYKNEISSRINLINKSILAKAFRGELVPQDPDDEPASVLLERIRAERDKLNNSKPKSDRTSKRKRKTVEGQGVLPGFE